MPKYNQMKVNPERKPVLQVGVVKRGIIEFLDKKSPGPLTTWWEVKRAAEVYVKYHLKYEKDSMNAEMFEGVPMDRMEAILKEMETQGTIGWAMEEGTTWGAHYYLVSHRREKPEIAHKWMFSEYTNGRQITNRCEPTMITGGKGHEIPA